MTNTDLENALKVMIGSLEALKMYFGTQILWNASPSKLPYGYTELEYISSTADGGLYINTGDTLFSEIADIDIEIKYNIKGPGLICATENNNQKFYTIFSCMREVNPWPGIVIRTFYNGSVERSNQTNNTNPKIDDTTRNSGLNEILEFLYSFEISNNGTHDIPVTLFTSLDSSSNLLRMAEADLYYVKYSKNNEVIRELIPAKNSNNIAGLYDTVNDVFFTSLGNSNFVAGPEVVQEENNNELNNELNEEFILPYDAELEYIESSGTLYIDTFYKVTPNMSFNSLILFVLNEHTNTSNGNNHNVFLATSDYEGDYNFGFNFGSKVEEDNDIIFWTNTKYLGGTVYRIDNISYDTLKNKFDLNYLSLLINLGTYLISVPLPTHTFTTETLLLFGGKDRTPFNRWNMRIYSMKIYDNNILIRDFIPVRRGQIGYLYDKVSRTLFNNQGTGRFIISSDKVPYDCRVEYLQSEGRTLYIDTLFELKDIEKFKIKYYSTYAQTPGWGNAMGCRYSSRNKEFLVTNFYQSISIGDRNENMGNSKDQINEITYNGGNTIIVNGTLKTLTYVLPLTQSYHVILFGIWSEEDNAVILLENTKIYHVVLEGNNKKLDLIPVRKNGIGYMYDLISGKLFGNSGTGSFTLGPDITEIQYLQATGTLYIDTGIICNGAYRFKTKFRYTTSLTSYDDNNSASVFGSRTSASLNTFLLSSYNNGSFSYYNHINPLLEINTINVDYTVEFRNNNKLYINDREVLTLTNLSFSTPTSLLLFALRNGSSVTERMLGRIYYFQLYDENGDLILDLIPVKIGLVGYMYDKVSNQLFGNAGTGNFTLGPTKAKYDAELYYLESTGTLYIDTNIIPDENTGIYAREVATDNNLDLYSVGLRDDNSDTRWTIGHNGSKWYYGYGTFDTIISNSYNGLIAGLFLNYLNSKVAKGIIPSVKTDNIVNLPTLSFTPSNVIRLFGSSGVVGNYSKWKGRIHAVKISQGSNVVMDLIPVRIGETGYMYDKISETLLSNNGTGNFVLGPDVNEIYDAELEYLESTGTLFMNLEYEIACNGLSAEIKMLRVGDNNSGGYIGRNSSGGLELYTKSTGEITLWVDTISWNAFELQSNISDKNTHIISFNIGANSTKLVVDGTEYTSNNIGSYDGKSPIQLFSHRGYYNSEGRIYYCKLWDNGIMVHDLIPVRVGNVGYMYDKITKLLFGNSGSGDFVLGPDKT